MRASRDRGEQRLERAHRIPRVGLDTMGEVVLVADDEFLDAADTVGAVDNEGAILDDGGIARDAVGEAHGGSGGDGAMGSSMTPGVARCEARCRAASLSRGTVESPSSRNLTLLK